jgi:hypothetical protein
MEMVQYHLEEPATKDFIKKISKITIVYLDV